MARCWVCRERPAEAVTGVCAGCVRQERFRPLRRLSAVVTAALLCCAVLAVLRIRAVTAGLSHVSDPPSPGPADLGAGSFEELERRRAERRALEEEILAADERVLERVEHTTLLLMAGVLVTAALFLYWLTVARRNAELFRPRRQRMNGTELVAAHLLPGVQLYAPRLAARDVWWASRPADGRPPSRLWFESWWLSWAAVVGAAYVAYWQWWENDATAFGEITSDGRLIPAAAPLADTLRWLLAVGVLTLLCVATAIAWVWRLTRLQETTRDGGPPPGPRPADPRLVSRAELVRRVVEHWRADREPSGADAGPDPSRPERSRADGVPSGR